MVLALLIATSASAQATRTWVSGVGDDVNPCSRTAPCKTFAGAISKTAACGEIDVLDSAGFGAVTITKSITIDGEGALAGVLHSGVNGIVVSLNASDACNTVILRNLSISGSSSNAATFGLNGIRVLGSVAATNVHIEHVSIQHDSQHGVDIAPSIAGFKVWMKDVDIRHVPSISASPGIGIESHPTAGQLVRLDMHDVRVRQTAVDAVRLSNNTDVTINFSQFEGNNNAINVLGNSIRLMMVNTVIANNTGTGLINSGGATTRLNGVTIMGNGTGINNGGTVTSFANSVNEANGTDLIGGAIGTGAHP